MRKKRGLKNYVSSLGPVLLLVWSSCGSLSAVTIMDVQGNGHFSPLAGEVVEVSGVVTFVRSQADGFFLQNPTGDGDRATSDGIFVSVEKGTSLPALGDGVRVIGRVEELQFGRALPRTQLDDVSSVKVVSTGSSLPTAIAMDGLPRESLKDGARFLGVPRGHAGVCAQGVGGSADFGLWRARGSHRSRCRAGLWICREGAPDLSSISW